MWCKDCRQDVPALLSCDKQAFCCPRCGGTLCAEYESRTDCQPVPEIDSPPCYDDWETGEELNEIGRALRGSKRDDRQSQSVYRRESMRFDRPHADLPDRHAPAVEQPSKRRMTTVDNRSAAPSALTWLSLALGITGSVCGGGLMGWSLVTGRQELWTIGLPVALVGQIALLVSLVLQLDRMRRDNHRAAAKLDNVDEQLRDLKTTTNLLSTSQGPASTTFYSHFAGGASPQLLLTDLKSQLDLLAMKIARDEQ